MKPIKNKRIIYILIAAIVLILIIISYEINIMKKNLQALNWTSIEGEVVQLRNKKRNSKIIYSYVINGKEYYGSRISFIRIDIDEYLQKYHEGSKLKVFVNPYKNSESILNPVIVIPFSHFAPTIFYIVGILIFSFGVAIYKEHQIYFLEPLMKKITGAK